MANYYGTSRTNYFRVTDEDRYKELFEGLSGEDTVHDFTKVDESGTIWHGFGCYGSVEYYPPSDDEDDWMDPDFDYFVAELQKILPENEAFIYCETGYEKLRYVAGNATIATRNGCDYVSLTDQAISAARSLLNDNTFRTQMEY